MSSANIGGWPIPDALSDFQRSILKDGVLTSQEYERAALAVAQCHRDSGAELRGYPQRLGGPQLSEPWWSKRGEYYYIPAYPEADTNAEGKYNACEDEYFRQIAPIWANHVAPSQQEMQQARDLVGECLREVGLAIPEHPDITDISPILTARRNDPAIAACSDRGAQFLGTIAFFG